MNILNIKQKHIFFYFVIFTISFIVDRVTKYLAIQYLSTEDIVANKILNFSLVWNRGINWGLFNSASENVFLLLTFVIILVIIIFFAYTAVQYYKSFDITFEILVLSGALSNVIDKLTYGAVIDFIEFHINNWYWPTFNFADIFIVIGVIGIVIKTIGKEHAQKN